MFERMMNMVDPRFLHHAINVATIFHNMLKAEGRLKIQSRKELVILAFFHDIGACTPEQDCRPSELDTGDVWKHSILSYLFLQQYFPKNDLVKVTLYHHLRCDQKIDENPEILWYAQLLHLADCISIWRDVQHHSKQEISDKIKAGSGSDFSPEAISLLCKSNLMYHTWQCLSMPRILKRIIADIGITSQEAERYLYLMANVIDFRSHNTAMHTRSVMEISLEMARLAGFSQKIQRKIYLGALLHDLGKIGIPIEILEKPGKLTPDEMQIMRLHVPLGESIIKGCVSDEVMQIALRHHEKPNGQGYPKGLSGSELTPPQRLLAVADVVSALCMVRSYKEAFPKSRCLSILREMADSNQLDKEMVKLVEDHFDRILSAAVQRCGPTQMQYIKMQQQYQKLLAKLSSI